MISQELTDYERIARAIDYLKEHFKRQPSLEEIAGNVYLSPYHFQRMFTAWAGVSPKKFTQYLSVGYAKSLLKERQTSLFDAAIETGLSGTGRLHDLFMNIEGMTPGEYKNGGEALSINYSFAESPFGPLILAATPKGLCYLAFEENRDLAFRQLQEQFPNARYQQVLDMIQQNALYFFTQDWTTLEKVRLHLKGTPFQLKVWEALLHIPMGALSTYGQVAGAAKADRAYQAVGTAIGSNPVAFLIPCHRVIRSNGEFGEYHWGATRKMAMIGWEAAKR
ncbi:methylated-DNA--[protein]-cysteine S-methyltransferase [Chitinophaga rhizophila]|uniref:Bifunctional helix-turn-helix domain-containing protein/methylated-DNA--[protein]-cysteine S-methyltransferase n=1 Tax=Chitinophaga rhizophila TaxID=2866212 RepID=A0ABS7GB01_9BACT|nr:bifunctional helix-turn-helix domain-containing protein/methylated-DNA--[protein]-cysteine S-methyltransferase [Chitinophaga rhizophila]MBW8683713.1 bifunctional helix-turn-helix domain-containing protein/methylated-DNA--[protein]-cysteine S-methyltransferase [Chitinophaga rhizophila]